MKTWIIASIMLGVLVIGGFAIVSALNSNNTDISDDGSTTQTVAKTISCSGCGNGCTAESNCGRATCGAVSGTGTCGCGK
ncbi:MAG: hypothetical protein ACP5NZ_00205 [Nanobdellota archaeon]